MASNPSPVTPLSSRLVLSERARWWLERAGEQRSAMFNEAWIGLVMLLLFIGFVVRQSNLPALAALLMTIVGLSWLWNRLALASVEYGRQFSESRAFAGEMIDLTVSVTNRKFLPLAWLHIEDHVPLKLPFANARVTPTAQPKVGALTHLTATRWFERVNWRYRVECKHRGFYFLGPARLRSGDIFGLFTSALTVAPQTRLIVYPRLIALSELGFPGKHPFGGQRAVQNIFEDPSRTVGVRDYHPEDPFKRIHWKASARRNQLQVRVLEPAIVPHLAVFLNVTTFEKHWHGTDTALLERTISVAASIADHAVRQKLAVGLIANGSVPHSDQSIKVMPGRAPNQLLKILEALAAITGFPTADFNQLLSAESSRLAWGATMVVVTCVVTEKLLATMLRLRHAGRPMALVSLDSEFKGDDTLSLSKGVEGIRIYHIDPDKIDLDDPGEWDKAE
ncbi:MAG: DUF58 domain-containing protein [Chloroflexi bacterium]|nr:DUF58 domain-containing protein [Chloroflexota bacterium]MBI3732306.1 DUF58 domain-containing protein [Chloroflexota bacterium]